MIHFLFPADPRRRDEPDVFFAGQAVALAAAGFTTSVASDAAVRGDRPLTGVPPGSRVVYRGWMLTGPEYRRLTGAIEAAGASAFTAPDEYLAAHHLPNWYPHVADLTPETRVYPADCNLAAEVRALGWGRVFVKDFVKSLKTRRGSVAADPEDAAALLAELRDYRGEIEGGVCVRRVEELLPESERRYFVLGGRPHSEDGSSVPEVVRGCAARLPMPFYSVDVARRADGAERVVEVGDGQVSDLVGWTDEAFAAVWSTFAGGAG